MSKPMTVQEQWIDQWAERIHNSGLSIVAIPLLEVSRGLGFLVSQFLLLTQPILVSVVDETNIRRCVTLLEDPAAIESLIERVERKARGDD